MRSQFGRAKRNIRASAKPIIDETYDLRGLNLITPDQIMPKGQAPLVLNSRMYARNDGEVRTAQKTRPGTANHSQPVGYAANVSNTGTVTGDASITPTSWKATPFTVNATGVLTNLDIWIKRNDGSAGPAIISIYTNDSGAPKDLVAQSSVSTSLLSLSYQWLTAYFIDAPTLTNGTQYWIVQHIQEEGLGSYDLGYTSASGGLQSSNSGGTWSTGPTIRYRTFLATEGKVRGWTRREPSTKNYRNMIAIGTSLYQIPDSPAIPVLVTNTLPATNTKVRFAQINDITFVAHGGVLEQWDETTYKATPGRSGNAINVVTFKNRLVVLGDDGLRADFSDLYNFESWPAVNFFYVGNPKSTDPVSGWKVFQDNLVIYTKQTKWILSGSDIGSFTMRQAVGTKGAISQEAMDADRNFIYSVAPDNTVNRFNGISDELISDAVQPELAQFQTFNDVSLVVFNNQVRIYYSKSPNVTVDRMLLYDVEFKEWFLDTGRLVLAGMSIVVSDKPRLIEISSRAGWLFIGESGTSDIGKALDWKYWEPYQKYGTGASKKRIKRFRPVLRASQARYSMKVGVDFNFLNKPDMRDYAVSGEGSTWGGGSTWGASSTTPATWGSTSLVDRPTPVSGRAEHIQYRYEKKGVDTPIRLYGRIVLLKEGRAR